MPFSRAEIQKAYRERKKATEGKHYLRKERRRRMKYYVPSADLTESQRKKRNKKNNKVLKRYRQKRKEQENYAQRNLIKIQAGMKLIKTQVDKIL